MATFDPKEVVVLLDGREISDWADGMYRARFAAP